MLEERKEIFVLRHGETDFNRQGIVQGSGIDADLNEQGHAQANQFYSRYGKYPFDLILCSALKRSYQTIASFGKSTPILKLSDLNEISWGVQEGMKSTPETIAQYKRVVAQWSAQDLEAKLPGGESARDLFDRMDRVKRLLQSMSYKKILVCMHGRSMRALMCRLLDQDASYMEEYKHHNAGFYKLNLNDHTFELILRNNTDHLS